MTIDRDVRKVRLLHFERSFCRRSPLSHPAAGRRAVKGAEALSAQVCGVGLVCRHCREQRLRLGDRGKQRRRCEALQGIA
jgi:hypothetical protein